MNLLVADPTSEITDTEAAMLLRAAEHGGITYNLGATPTRMDARHAQQFQALAAPLELVDFTGHLEAGWTRGMWSARLTWRGWNALFRHTGATEGTADRHVGGGINARGARRIGCDGVWLPNGTCSTCGALRPLDATAYDVYLAATDEDTRARSERGPRLLCREHGRMRLEHITTQKVCLLSGTVNHSGGLYRL